MRRFLFVLSIATLAAVVLGGCGSDTDSATKKPKAAKASDANGKQSCGEVAGIKDSDVVAEGVACYEALRVVNDWLPRSSCGPLLCDVDGYSCQNDTCTKGSVRITMNLSPTTPAGKYPATDTKEITIRVMSGREQPAPESWTAKVGQVVIFTIEGIGPPKVGIVGPGLGEPTDSSYGLTNVTGQTVSTQLKFTPKEPGGFRVSEIESSLPLGTLTVTK